MKKLWLFLLSLGLIMAFSVSAFAVDVKVTGEYYAAGLYLSELDVRMIQQQLRISARRSSTRGCAWERTLSSLRV